MLRQCLSGIAIGLSCLATSVQAQSQFSDANPAYLYGNNNGSGNTSVTVQHHASTAYEGAMRGQADWMRGYGEGSRELAEGAVAAQQAREHALRNNQLAVEMYYQRKAMYKAYCDSQKPKSYGTTYDSAHLSDNRSAPVAPQAVSVDGLINWPTAFQSESSRIARQKLDSFFAHHGPGYSTGVGTKDYEDARLAMDDLRTELKSRISDLPAGDYLAAKKFLKSLDDAARKNPQLAYLSQN